MQVTQTRKALGDRPDRKVLRLDVVDLVPADRGGDGRLLDPTDRVGARDGVVSGVLVVVHEHLAWVAVLAPPRGRGVVGHPPLHLAGERQRGPSHVGEPPQRRDPHVDVQAVPTRGLGPADGSQLVEHLVGGAGNSPHPLQAAIGHRIEVDAPFVGAFHIGAPRVPGVELDRRHLDRPDHAGQLGHAQLVGGAAEAREVEGHGLDPRRGALRQALLVDLLAVDAAREPVQHAGAFPQRAHDPVPDAHVVLRKVELGLPVRGEVDPIGVGDPHGPAAYGKLDCVVAGHGHGH